MTALRDLLLTLAIEIESVEGLLLAARAHLGEMRRNGWDASDAQASVDALERNLEALKDQADALKKKMH